MQVVELVSGVVPWIDLRSDEAVIMTVCVDKKQPSAQLPADMHTTLRGVLELCWASDPTQRPSFERIVCELEEHAPPREPLSSAAGYNDALVKKVEEIDLKHRMLLLRILNEQRDLVPTLLQGMDAR